MKRYWLMTPLLVGCFAVNSVHAGEPAPGAYISKGGWGNLVITRSGKTLAFKIDAVGGNGHLCSLDGPILGSRAVLKPAEDMPACTVLFTPGDASIQVTTPDVQACRDLFCGARAFFEGPYLLPSKNCAPKGKALTRNKFDAYYRAKSYERAVSTLNGLLTECAETLAWAEEDRIRTDLSIALYHAGKLDECMSVLQPVLNKAHNEEELSQGFPPADFEVFQPIARAAWHNAKLCSKNK